jgi:hypothetical protein
MECHPFEVLGFGGRLCSASLQYAEAGKKGAQLDDFFLIGWSASQRRPSLAGSPAKQAGSPLLGEMAIYEQQFS